MTGLHRLSIGVLALAVSACTNSGGPGSPLAHGALTLSNLAVTELGLQHALCGGDFEYTAWDELRVDFSGAGDAGMVGATVFHVAPDNARTLIGTAAACSADPSPCNSGPKICVNRVNSTDRGSLRIIARAPWTPTRTWSLNATTETERSNTVTAAITRPDGLPFGDQAAIAFFRVIRLNNSTLGQLNFSFWSPAVVGRTLVFTVETLSGSTRVDFRTFSTAEVRLQTLHVFLSSVTLPPGPAQVIGRLEERDAFGNVLVTDQRTISVQ